MKHLVTSGCSFSDNFEERWPHYLAKKIEAVLYNRGLGSADNGYISKTIIYQIQQLLSDNVDPKDIIVAVMWSGINRSSNFINKDTASFSQLINNKKGAQSNPVNFINSEANLNLNDDSYDVMNFLSNIPEVGGWLLGSIGCFFHNENILEYKAQYYSQYKNNESLLIDSLHYWLQIQWLCSAYKIPLINMTYLDIWHFPYPADKNKPTIKENYSYNASHLYEMLDLNTWFFYKNTAGLYEYTKDNNLSFNSDNYHPASTSHEHYVDNFLIPELKGRKII